MINRFNAPFQFRIGMVHFFDKVGSLAGEFRVAESGAATYSIPLALPPGTAGEAPILELMGPLYVVTQVRSSAPVAGNAGAMSGIGYVYERGKAQAAGRGLLGFRTLTTVDLQTGVRTTTTYRQDFPYIGLPLRTEVRTASGKLLRTAQNTWKLKGYDPAWDARTVSSGPLTGTGSARLGSLQPYIETSVEEDYDLPTTSNGTETAGAKLTTVTTVTDVDTYGNPTTITATTRDHASTRRFQQVTENTYGAESDTWSKQFGRLTKTKVTRRRNETANDDNYDAGLTASRTSAFTYFNTTDHKNGLLHTEVREPDDAALRHTTTYDYDAFGNRVKARVQAASGPAAGSSTETRCDHNTLEYDPYGRFVVKEWDCLGRLVRRMSTYNGHGLPAQSERVINSSPLRTVSTEYSYTDGGRLYFSHGADGSYTGTVWKACDSNCPAGAKYYLETRRAGGGVSREYRDALDRVVRMQVQGFDANTWITADTDYDPLGRVARRSEPFHALADRHWTRYEYDLLGRVTRTELPDYEAGSADSNSVITVRYAGRVATTTNALGQRQVQTRNALDEVIRTADHLGTTVTHAYNAWGQVTGTTTSGAGVSPAVVERDYDGRGRRTELRDPDRGTWKYEYNGFDELVKQTDAVGNVQALAYDGLGRLATRRDYRAGLRTAVAVSHWVYDPANGLGQPGDVWELTDSGYRRSTTYDRLGRVDVTERQLLFDNERHYSRQTYDAYGRPHQHFDASRSAATWTDNVVEVQYNAQGYAYRWVDGVHVGNAPRRTYREITARDARGNVTGERLGAGAVRTVRGFDAATGRIESITSRDALRREIQALTYEWDLVGNLTGRMEASVGKSLTEAFAYDTLNRLTSARVTGRTAQVAAYDALGNITCKSDVDGTDCTVAGARNYTYGTGTGTEMAAAPGPHAVTRAGNLHYSYDNNGNVLTERRTGASSDARTFTYHAFNKVKSITKGTHTTSFAYGPARTRIKRTDTVVTGSGASTTTTLYLGNVEKVIAPDGSFTFKRYIADGVLIEQTHDTGGNRDGEATRYLLYDHLGSIDVITDVTGTVVQDLSFDAWGQRRAPDDWTVLALMRLMDTTHGSITPYGFTGHEMLDAVGIIHMNGRIYDPALGRFLQADPIIQFPNHSQSWNRYSYVLNNPLNATDPSGYFLKKLFRKVVGFALNGIGEILFSKVPVLRQFSTLAHCLSGNPVQCGAAAAGNAYAGGASLKRALKAGVFAYVSAKAFTAVGDYFQAIEAVGGWGHFGAHALTGGILTELQGGEFGHGFLSAGVAFGVGQIGIKQGWSVEAQFVSRVVSAGTVSEITGGKFANGAVTAAFAFVYNELAHQAAQRSIREQQGEFREVGNEDGTNDVNGVKASLCGRGSVICEATTTSGIGYEDGNKVAVYICENSGGRCVVIAPSNNQDVFGVVLGTTYDRMNGGFTSYPKGTEPFEVNPDSWLHRNVIYNKRFIQELEKVQVNE